MLFSRIPKLDKHCQVTRKLWAKYQTYSAKWSKSEVTHSYKFFSYVKYYARFYGRRRTHDICPQESSDLSGKENYRRLLDYKMKQDITYLEEHIWKEKSSRFPFVTIPALKVCLVEVFKATSFLFPFQSQLPSKPKLALCMARNVC